MSIRAVERVDLALLRACREDPAEVPWGFFGFTAAESLDKAFEANGLLNDDKGTLAVLSSGALIGRASWSAVQHGPTVACRALNVGMTLVPEARGQGHGTAALRALVEYLFQVTTVPTT